MAVKARRTIPTINDVDIFYPGINGCAIHCYSASASGTYFRQNSFLTMGIWECWSPKVLGFSERVAAVVARGDARNWLSANQ